MIEDKKGETLRREGWTLAGKHLKKWQTHTAMYTCHDAWAWLFDVQFMQMPVALLDNLESPMFWERVKKNVS